MCADAGANFVGWFLLNSLLHIFCIDILFMCFYSDLCDPLFDLRHVILPDKSEVSVFAISKNLPFSSMANYPQFPWRSRAVGAQLEIPSRPAGGFLGFSIYMKTTHPPVP